MNEVFSIVIPVYNRASIVCRTLDSIKSQTYRPIHLILVDNNSSDNTMEVLQDWKSANETNNFIVNIIEEHTPGAASARNAGLKCVSTDKMLFFDSDDTMRPTLVERYIELFNNNPDAQIVYTKGMLHKIDGTQRTMKFATRNILRNHIFHAILRTHGYAVKTNYIRKIGRWNSSVGGWDDWELGIRLLLLNPQTAILNDTLVDIYAQEESITGISFSEKKGQWEYAMDIADHAIENSQRKDKISLHRLIDYRRVVLAAHYSKEGNHNVAKSLYSSTIEKNRNDWRMRLLMPIVFHYVRLGGRGAASIINYLI